MTLDKKLILEVLREVGLDILIMSVLPMVKAWFSGSSKVSPEEVEKLNRILETHAGNVGNRAELVKQISTWFFNVTLRDEQKLDSDFERARKLVSENPARFFDFLKWLAADSKRRLVFRTSLLYEENIDVRVSIILGYIQMNTDKERDARLYATGKMDPGPVEKLWYALLERFAFKRVRDGVLGLGEVMEKKRKKSRQKPVIRVANFLFR